MANFTENSNWTETINKIKTDDPVLGGVDDSPLNKGTGQLANRTQFLKQQQADLLRLTGDNKTTTDGEIVDLKNDKANKNTVNKTITDLSKTQINGYTGFDDMPLFSISPMMHYGVNPYFSLSKKWTYCNGAAVAIGANTFTLAQTAQYLKTDFVKHFNNSIAVITNVPVGLRPRQIKLGGSASDYSIGGSSYLWIPNLWGAGLFFRTGGGGHMSGDAIRNIVGNYTGDFGLIDDGVKTTGAFGHHLIGYRHHYTYSKRDGVMLDFDASRVVPTSFENRPVNINMPVYFKIK